MVHTSYCFKCKKKTASSGRPVVVTVKSDNKKWREKSVCKVCRSEKSSFVKAPTQQRQKTRDGEEADSAMAEAIELHAPVVRRFPKRVIVTLGVDDLWAADLVVMDRFRDENDGYRYMLNVIDTFSKFAWSRPLYTKSGAEVTRAFEDILDGTANDGGGHRPPRLLHTDKGREFENKEFKRLLLQRGITMYHTENEEKSAIVERFNRSLNERMRVRFEVDKSFRWVDALRGLLSDYNDSVHSTIRTAPSAVNESNESEIRLLYDERRRRVEAAAGRPKLRVGDRVRITAKKEVFANKYARNWRREIFTVSRVLSTAPVTYRIEDSAGEEILGSFYERELQKTAF